MSRMFDIRSVRRYAIGAGFGLLGATGVHRLAAPFTRGLGAILMFHRVRPWDGESFAPNRLLEITPDFLDATITAIRAAGFDIVSVDDALARLDSGEGGRAPFAVLTFDDGYRDTRDVALPILKRHAAPFTVYATTDFAEGTGRLWWCELEEALRRLPSVRLTIAGETLVMPTTTASEKQAAWDALYWRLRGGSEADLLAAVATLCADAGVDSEALTRAACLDWPGLAELAAEPLCTIGAHTVSHPILAKHADADVRHELEAGRTRIAANLGLTPHHVAFPVGDPTSAGPREFAMAAELGFASAVTTRPGMIFADHAARRTALPRVSVNGLWQDTRYLDMLLSGAPFWLWNRGRRVAA